jgi:hypothetical protein
LFATRRTTVIRNVDSDVCSIDHVSTLTSSDSAGRSSDVVKEPSTVQRLVFYAIGVLLTFTALAKLWMICTDPFADIRVGLNSEIIWLSIVFELWLAYMNFRIHNVSILALINVVVFAGFAIFGAIRMALGYSSCGCSGSIEIPGWVFILVDLAIVATLVCLSARGLGGNQTTRDTTVAVGWIRQGIWELRSWWQNCSSATKGRCAGVGLFGVGVVALQFQLFAPLRAVVLGQPLIQAEVSMPERDSLRVGVESTGEVTLRNLTDTPVKIVGFERSCRCVGFESNPTSQVIPAFGDVALLFSVVPKKPGPVYQRIILYTDHPKQFRVTADVLGSVKE